VYEYFPDDTMYVHQRKVRDPNAHEEGTGLYTAAVDRYLKDQ